MAGSSSSTGGSTGPPLFVFSSGSTEKRSSNTMSAWNPNLQVAEEIANLLLAHTSPLAFNHKKMGHFNQLEWYAQLPDFNRYLLLILCRALVGKAGGKKWKSLSPAEKAPYEAKAAKRKAENEKQMKPYNKKEESAADDGDEDNEKSKSEVDEARGEEAAPEEEEAEDDEEEDEDND